MAPFLQLSVVGISSIAQQLLAVCIAFLIVAWVPALMRLWVRAVTIRSLGWDDYTIFLSLVAFTVQCGYGIKLATLESNPDHVAELGQVLGLIQDFIAFSGSYVMTTIVLKVSLALFFLRIIIDKSHRMVIYVLLAIYTAFGLAYFGITVFRCGAPSMLAENTLANKCIDLHTVIVPASYAQTAFNGLTDWVYAILGVMTLWRLNMPQITKVWAGVLLALGAIGSIASLVRIAYVPGLDPTADFFKTSGHLEIWSVVENGLGIAAVCLATLRPLFARCLGSRNNTYATPSRRTETRVRGGTNFPGGDNISLSSGIGARTDIAGGPRMSISDDGSEVELAQVTVKTDISKSYA